MDPDASRSTTTCTRCSRTRPVRRSWWRRRRSGCAAAPTAGRRGTSTTDGMEMSYARGVAIVGDDVVVTVSDGPWAERSAVYRAPVDGGPVAKVTGGLPEYLPGNIDSRCIASDGTRVALVDGDGDVWQSADRLRRVRAHRRRHHRASPGSRSPERGTDVPLRCAVRAGSCSRKGPDEPDRRNRRRRPSGRRAEDVRVERRAPGRPTPVVRRRAAHGHARPGVHRGRHARAPTSPWCCTSSTPRRPSPTGARTHPPSWSRSPSSTRRPPTCSAPGTRCSCGGSPTCA